MDRAPDSRVVGKAESADRERRGETGTWLVIALAALVLGDPLGLALAGMGVVSANAWLWGYALAIAVAAVFALAWLLTRRRGAATR